MQVKDIMTYGVDYLTPADTVRTAAERMRDENVGVFPVFDRDEPVGMVTDRDVTVRCVAEGLNPAETKVTGVMTPEVFFCMENADVETAAHIMEYKQIRRLLVKNDDGKVIGILALGDIAMSTNNELSGEVLHDVSGLSYPKR
ncbi:MAG: CBS domain-containing protein [Chitinispirillaceae bacterium]